MQCTCGNEFITRATQDELHVEVCSNCHPFYTGRQKLVDSGGRVERFQRRVAKGRSSAQTRCRQAADGRGGRGRASRAPQTARRRSAIAGGRAGAAAGDGGRTLMPTAS